MKKDRSSIKWQPIAQSLFIISLLLIVIQGFANSFDGFKQGSLFASQLIDLSLAMRSGKVVLVAFAIFSGFFTFYLSPIKNKAVAHNKSKEADAENNRHIIRWRDREGWGFSLSLLVISLVSLSFMLPGLGGFLTVDEPNWLDTGTGAKLFPASYEAAFDQNYIRGSDARSEVYWDSYLTGNFKGTFNNPNPSATLSFLHLPAYVIKGSSTLQTYLFSARATIIIHNLLLLLLLYYLMKRLTSKEQALLFFAAFALLPQFIGYSRIFNHDSLQGFYILAFILSLWTGLKDDQRKYYIISGAFYALALLTQFKSIFIQPLLFLLPVIYSYSTGDLSKINNFLKKTGWFFLSAVIVSVLVLPAGLFYPVIIVETLFLYPKFMPLIIPFLIILLMLLSANSARSQAWLQKIKTIEATAVNITLVLLSALLIFLALNRSTMVEIINKPVERYYTSYYEAIIASYATFFFGIPLILVLFFVIWVFLSHKKKRFDLSFFLVSLFFLLIPLAVISFSRSSNDGSVEVMILGTRYLFVLLPMFIAGLFLSPLKLSKKSFSGAIITFVIVLTISNFHISPFFIMYNNVLLPKGTLIARSTWASDTGETSRYINTNFSNVTIYNPRGVIKNFLREDITVIPWTKEFWKHKPDYIIVEWEKSHRFAKILDHYRENKKPLWHIEKNGAIVTGIYAFDKSLDYKKILHQGKKQ